MLTPRMLAGLALMGLAGCGQTKAAGVATEGRPAHRPATGAGCILSGNSASPRRTARPPSSRPA